MVSVVIAGLLLAGQAAQAVPTVKPELDPNKKVCRREIITGSNMTKSTCHTRAEWAALDKAENRAGDDFRNTVGRSGRGVQSGL